MKNKMDQIRTYDKDGLRRRAACICLRSEECKEVLLVTSSRYSHLWIVPGGGLDPGEDPVTAALREIREEAGVNGKLFGLLGVFENRDRSTRTYVYIVIVESLSDDYEDAKKIGRARKWFTLEDARAALQIHKPVQNAYLEMFIEQKISGIRSSAPHKQTDSGSSMPLSCSSRKNTEPTSDVINLDSSFAGTPLSRDSKHVRVQ